MIEADIVQYFDNIRHDRLSDVLKQALTHCDDVDPILGFADQALEHQANELKTPGRGLAQGSPSSPILSNLYLDALDERIEAKGVKLVRFADDFLIFCKRRKTALEALENARHVLTELGLDLHDDGTGLTDFDRGFDFLGHLFVRSLALKKEAKPQPQSSVQDIPINEVVYEIKEADAQAKRADAPERETARAPP